MKILFLVPYPLNESPSQRFRFEQYFNILVTRGHSFTVQSFLDSQNWRYFFKPGNQVIKIVALIIGFFKRLSLLFLLPKYDFIFIHREAAPLGPPVFEWIISRFLKKRIVYDFDDAIWLTDRSKESFWLKTIKWRSKVESICRWSFRVSCGNDYLCQYAQQFNSSVIYNPTTIDTEGLHSPSYFRGSVKESVTIGWTGSHSTLKYLLGLEDVLRKIEILFPFVKVMIIADRAPEIKLTSVVYKPWSIESEISDLNKFDIGLMPLPDDDWSKGKCGFKALQYMALEIPTIASAVGVNATIIDHGINGFLAASSSDWEHYLKLLITDKQVRERIGKKGREKVISHYSTGFNSENFLSLFD